MNTPEFHYESPDVPMLILEEAGLFRPGFNDTIDMPSGKRLRGFSDHEFISLSNDANFPVYVFKMQLFVDTPRPGLDSITFAAGNMERLNYPERHPDMYMGRLMTRGLAYIEQTLREGQPVHQVKTTWHAQMNELGRPQSTDFIEYLNNRLHRGNTASRAAADTWSGRWARSQRFTEAVPNYFSAGDTYMDVRFRRPLESNQPDFSG